MRPTITPNDMPNGSLAQLVFTRKTSNVAAIRPLSTDGPDGFGCDFRTTMRLSAQNLLRMCMAIMRRTTPATLRVENAAISQPYTPTTFARHISLIVGGSSQEQVLGIDAMRYIAAVADIEAGDERTVSKEVCDAMGAACPDAWVIAHSIASRGTGSRPKPTTGRTRNLINVGPKALGGRNVTSASVPVNIAPRLAFGHAPFANSLCDYVCRLTTAAFTKFRGWCYSVHGNSPYTRIVRAEGVSRTARLCCVHYTTNAGSCLL